MTELQSVIEHLEARRDALLANSERTQAAGVQEAIQALRRLVPAPVKAPEPPVEAAPPPELEQETEPAKKLLGVF
jgi:hypothetical protein